MARRDELFLNNARVAGGLEPPPSPIVNSAKRLPGTDPCCTSDLKDMLQCLGGIRLLFPLFGQLDLPVREYLEAPMQIPLKFNADDPDTGLQAHRIERRST
eukprot:123839_1